MIQNVVSAYPRYMCRSCDIPGLRTLVLLFIIFQAVDWAHVTLSSQWSTWFTLKDLGKCNCISLYLFWQDLQAGIVWVNCSQPCFCQAPWGGTKRSGFGRELGEWWKQIHFLFFVFFFFFSPSLSLLLYWQWGRFLFQSQGARKLLEREAGDWVCLRWTMGLVPISFKVMKIIGLETRCRMMDCTSMQCKGVLADACIESFHSCDVWVCISFSISCYRLVKEGVMINKRCKEVQLVWRPSRKLRALVFLPFFFPLLDGASVSKLSIFFTLIGCIFGDEKWGSLGIFSTSRKALENTIFPTLTIGDCQARIKWKVWFIHTEVSTFPCLSLHFPSYQGTYLHPNTT